MKNKNYGFTLIELLLVVALMAISVGVTSDILVSLIRSYNKSKIINELEQNANFVTQKLTKELRNATRIIDLSDGTAEPGSPPDIGDNSTALWFETRNGTEVVYMIEDGKVTRIFSGVSGDLTSEDESFGINVTCGETNCFKLIEDNPQVVKISIKMVPRNVTNVIFAGNVTIEDTIVIRNTY